MTPRVAEPPRLSEADTLKLAQLDIRDAAGQLTDSRERLHWKALKADTPARPRTLGGRVVTSHAYKKFAAKAISSNTRTALVHEDVRLASAGANETKTLLRAGSATSVGAFQSLDTSGEYARPGGRSS